MNSYFRGNLESRKLSGAGRPERLRFARQQTKLWATAVLVHAGCRDFAELESILGTDGRWEGLWSRYSRGLVSPSIDRIRRIDKILPYTARYFNSACWLLIPNDDPQWELLQDVADELPPTLRRLTSIGDSMRFGRIALGPYDYLNLPAQLIESMKSSGCALDALSVALLAIREAQLCRDEFGFLWGCRTLVQLSLAMGDHPIMKEFSTHWINRIVEPLRTIRFVSKNADESWRGHCRLCAQASKQSLRSVDIPGCLLTFNIWLAEPGNDDEEG